MGLMDGKVALIFGVANKNSIAWGITKRLHEEGATVLLSYAGGDALAKRVIPLAEEIGCDFIEECDVTSDEDLDNLFAKVKERYGKLDVLVHSIAYARREDLGGRFIDISRDGFKLALDISAFSLIAMSQRAEKLMTDGGSIMGMTYFAAEKAVPGYNVMSVAKAALESIVRYLAVDLGQQNIRVNAISAGPVKTLSGSGVPNFRKLLRFAELTSPMRTLIDIEDVGNLAVYLGSDWGRMVTGEVIHIDAGYNIMGFTATDELMEHL